MGSYRIIGMNLFLLLLAVEEGLASIKIMSIPPKKRQTERLSQFNMRLLLAVVTTFCISLALAISPVVRYRASHKQMSKQLYDTSQRLLELQRSQEQVLQRVKGQMPVHTSGGRNAMQVVPGAIQCPLNAFILIRTPMGIGAMRFTDEQESTVNSLPIQTADFEWYYDANSSGIFTDPDVLTGKGTVSAKFSPFQSPEHAGMMADEGSELCIRFGSIEIEWSYSRWLYLPNDRLYEVALVNASHISEVDAFAPSLIWCRRGSGAGAD
jgi:hypothetical protein